jgi:uncharacterized protein (DUF2164 family)
MGRVLGPGFLGIKKGRFVTGCARGTNATISFTMTIELNRDVRQTAIASIERYFLEHMDQKIGNISAGALLGFFLEEIGPVVYNQAVAQVQERLALRVSEIDIEVHEEEFDYWRKYDKQKTEAQKKKQARP